MTPDERSYIATLISSVRDEIRDLTRHHTVERRSLAKRNHALLRVNARLRAEAKLNHQLILFIREQREIKETLKELLDKRELSVDETKAIEQDYRYNANKTLE